MAEQKESKEDTILRFIEERGTSEDVTVEARPELTKLISKLDQLYWAEVEDILIQHARDMGDRLLFNKYERFVIDAGMIDPRLIGKNAQAVQNELLKEIYAEGSPTYFYFSQWLAERYRAGLLLQDVGEESSGKASLMEQLDANPAVKKLRATRQKVYATLTPFLKNIPGFKPDAVEMLRAGRLDSHIESLTYEAGHRKDERLAEQRAKLAQVRDRMLEKARDRCTTQKQLSLFDALGLLDAKIVEEILSSMASKVARGPAQAGEKKGLTRSQRIQLITGELKLVKSLLRLGTTGAGLTRTHSVLLSDHDRLTKPAVASIMDKVREVDPGLPGHPNILIAPFLGLGFFEWDRDTIFVPLLPTRSPEEAIVAALGNYRMMIDTLHSEGRLKKLYESRLGGGDFRVNFLRDYQSWVLGVGRGFRGALDPDRYAFFRELVGPNSNTLFAPSDLSSLTPNERREKLKECRGRINRQEAVFEDHYQLGVIYMLENRWQDALDQLAVAVRINPADGRAMYSLAHLCRALGIRDKALMAYKECLNIAPNTIWHVYASDEISKLE